MEMIKIFCYAFLHLISELYNNI